FAMPAALWTALTLHHGSAPVNLSTVQWLYPAAVLSSVPVFARIGLYRAVIRFMGVRAALTICVGVAFSAVTLATLSRFVSDDPTPIEAFVIYFSLALLYVGATRFAARELLRIRPASSERVVIYGAGAAGAQLCQSLVTSAQFRTVAMVDDNKKI